MKKNIVCGLDIGTFKICLVCAEKDTCGKINILANCTVPAQGINQGRIVDSEKLSRCIQEACKGIRKMSAIRIRRVFANIDAPDVKSKLCKKNIAFSDKASITKSQIEQLLDQAVCAHLPLGRKILSTGYNNFIFEEKRAENALGNRIDCPKMGINILLVSALIPTINNLVKSIKDAGLVVEDLLPSTCAQILALFKESKVEQGADTILIDMGAGLTKATRFNQKLIKDILILPKGAKSITEDIAAKLKLSFDCAERIKTEYGKVHRQDRFTQQRIIVKDKLSNTFIQPGILYGIINAKIDSFLQELKKILQQLNYEDKEVSQIIVTGGGAVLDGLLERTEQILHKPVRLGFLSAINHRYIQAQSSVFSTAIGLLHFGFKIKEKRFIFMGKKIDSVVRKLDRAKQLYREYF